MPEKILFSMFVKIPVLVVQRILIAFLLMTCLYNNISYSSELISATSYSFEFIRSISDHKKPVNSITFSPDGKILAGGYADGNVKLWESGSWKQIKSLIRHPYAITSVAFSPDGNILACGADSGAITLWDLNYKEKIRTFKEHEGKVCSIFFSSDGKKLISSSDDKTIRLRDMESGKEIKVLRNHTGSVNSIALSKDNKTLVSGSSDGTVIITDMATGESVKRIKTDPINSIDLSPDGRFVATGSSDGKINIIDIESAEEKMSFADLKGSIGIGSCLHFSPDSRLIVAGYSDSTIIVREISSGKIVSEIRMGMKRINSITFNPDGKILASAGEDNDIKLWKLTVTEYLKSTLTTNYEGWQRGILKLSAEVFGNADIAKFQYSQDGSTWNDIVEKHEQDYSYDWDTRATFPNIANNIQLRFVAEKGSGISAMDLAPYSFSIDNEPPSTKDDYDGKWHNSDFIINLKANDGDGIGILSTIYKINYGKERNLLLEGQPKIDHEGINVLEYWSVDRLGNAEEHKVLSDIKLDKTPPVFLDWSREPQSLPDEYKGSFRIKVRVIDEISGLEGKNPQIDFHIGSISSYSGYTNMNKDDNGFWYYDIPEPGNGWSLYKNESIYYKIRCEDIAGNISESAERQELIGSMKMPPVVKIINDFGSWQKGKIPIELSAYDNDGVISGIQLEYSLDGYRWNLITKVTDFSYAIEWDSTTVVTDIAKSVRIRAVATDNDNLQARDTSASFGIDNQTPITIHDYDGTWRKSSFKVSLKATDGEGSGIRTIKYKLNDSYEKSIDVDGQPDIDEQGENKLEYWSIDNAGNEEPHKILSRVRLDRLPPIFDDWNVKQNGNKLIVELKIIDSESGLAGTPELDYRIGADKQYSSVRMTQENEKWIYDIDISKIPESAGNKLYCKVNARDNAGNLGIKVWEYEIAREAIVQKQEPVGREEIISQRVDMPLQVTSKDEEEDIQIPESKSLLKKASITWEGKVPSNVKVEEKVLLQGHLEAKAKKNVPVKITLISPDDTIYVSYVKTNLKGDFDLSVPISKEGEWRILATWDGNSEYEETISDTIKIIASKEKVIKEHSNETKGFLSKKTVLIGVLAVYLVIIAIFR